MMRKWLIGSLVGIAALYLGWQVIEYRHHLSFVPPDMGVWRVRYVSEKAVGFGPGANEAGIIVFDLPSDTVAAIETGGIAWLDALRTTNLAQGTNWQATPLVTDEPWADPALCSASGSEPSELATSHNCPGIAGFLDRYGIYLSLDPAVEKLVNDAIFATGSYYAFGRTGLLIVIPAQARVVFVYSG